ncbi:MAG: hypothetical protein WCP80_03655 [Phycisphaerales bacterium]
MGSLDSNPAKERLAGFITLAVILLSTLTLLVATQVDWHSYTQYRLVFSLLQDAAGIQPGTPVNVGGLAYGKVLRVKTGPLLDETGNFRVNTPPLSADTANTLGTFVIFELDSRISLWPSAQICRTATVLGGNVAIQIYDNGFETQTDPVFSKSHTPVIAGATIRASNPPSGMSTIFGGPVALKLDKMYSEISLFYEWFTNQARKEIASQLQTLKSSVDSIRSKVKADTTEWEPRIASLKSTSAEMSRRLGISNSGEQDPTSISAIINKDSPQIRADLDSVQSDYTAIAAEIKNKLSSQMTKAYEDFEKQFTRLKADMESVTAAGKNANDLYAASVSQLSLSGGQITRAFQDLLGGLARAILEKPDDAEFAQQDQLMIARGLALQAQEVQLSVEDLEKLATQMKTNSPQMADEIRQRTAATLAELKKSLDAFNATLQAQYRK